MTYEDALGYLEGLINYERQPVKGYKSSFKLERLKAFLKSIGDPQERLSVIHVAGTKGKGSTSCFIAQILRQAGYRTGLYTSPHLQDIRERIRLFDPRHTSGEHSSFPGMILKNEFSELIGQTAEEAARFEAGPGEHGPLTFFEFLTAAAFQYFASRNTDFVVLETGLGGRLDATNVASSLVSVITPVSYDHEQVLGTTLPEIAFEKAGIVKSSNRRSRQEAGVCVSSCQLKEVSLVLRRRCSTEGAALLEMDKHFSYKRLSNDLLSQKFFYQGIAGKSHFFDIRMLGEHQLGNAALALAATEALSLYGHDISYAAMAEGLKQAYWPGRLEVISTQPYIILDGAHNRESAHRLVHFIEKEFGQFRKWLVFGASKDKDLKGLAELFESLADRVILTRSANPRAADPETDLKTHFKNSPFKMTSCVEEALDILSREMGPQEVAVITGSLFVVGEVRSLWQK